MRYNSLLKKRGFSLVELMVSLLIVSIAMLGFAALMAYSNRVINSNYSKNLGTDSLQAMVNVLSKSRNILSTLKGNEALSLDADNVRVLNDTIIITCQYGNTASTADVKMENGLSFDTSSAQNAFKGIADNVCGIAGTLQEVRQKALEVHISIENDHGVFYKYIANIHLALQLLKDADAKNANSTLANDALATSDSLIDTYCPFDALSDSEIIAKNKERIEDNVVCQTVEIKL